MRIIYPAGILTAATIYFTAHIPTHRHTHVTCCTHYGSDLHVYLRCYYRSLKYYSVKLCHCVILINYFFVVGFTLLHCGHCFIPLTLTCRVSCSTLSGCDLRPHWLIRVKSDNYARHSIGSSRDASEVNVLQSIHYTVSHGPNDLIVCERYDSNASTTFNISITSIGNHDEVLVTCGIESNLDSEYIEEVHNWMAVRKCECIIIVLHSFISFLTFLFYTIL